VRTVEVGNRLVLVPYWEPCDPASDRINLVIDPGPSFGSGDHPTTLMALELLEIAIEQAKEGNPRPTILDLGTGTGILAIAAKALGTGLTVGLDPDSAAVFTARRNIALNAPVLKNKGGHDSIHLFIGEAGSVGSAFNIVAANLVAPLLLRIHQDIARLVNHLLVLSGIADPLEREVIDKFRNAGLDPITRSNSKGWNAVLLRKR
jgi:ribosomal protein L11 methyltransferase